MICSIVAYCLRFTDNDDSASLLITGVIILGVSALVLVITKFFFTPRILVFIANAVALGFCVRSWYVFRGFDNPLWLMLLVSLSCLLYLLGFYYLLRIPFFERHFKIYFWVFLVITVIIYIMLVCLTDTTFVSTFGFYLIVEVAFIFAMCKSCDSIQILFWNITVSTYSVIVVAIIIALIMLLGDNADFLDGVSGDFDLSVASPKAEEVNNKKENLTSIDIFEKGKWL